MKQPAGNLLVYGSTGFTGRLLLESLRARGIEFVVAGRNPARVAGVAKQFVAPARCFSLDDPQRIDAELAGVRLLLNAAGPFLRTAPPLLDACLRNQIHYLDVSGELDTLQGAASLDAPARAQGVMLLPGVGFDVVPSDCLALHLKHRLPEAERLVLSISGTNLMSRGSALTFAEHVGRPMYVRRAGRLEPVWLRTPVRWANFGEGPRPTVVASWGDLVTAFHSTRIPDIEVYFEANTARWLAIATNQYCGWMFRPAWARNWLRNQVAQLRSGPTESERRSASAVILGEVWAGRRRVRARLVTPEAYTFTALAGAAVVERVLGGAVRSGFQTPAGLLGSDFVLSLDGVKREDLS